MESLEDKIYSLILVPTRELALQVNKVFKSCLYKKNTQNNENDCKIPKVSLLIGATSILICMGYVFY